jgi:hypothetical protein
VIKLWLLISCTMMALLMAAAPQPPELAVAATETEQLSAPPMPTRTTGDLTPTPTLTPAAAYPGPEITIEATIVAYPDPPTNVEATGFHSKNSPVSGNVSAILFSLVAICAIGWARYRIRL